MHAFKTPPLYNIPPLSTLTRLGTTYLNKWCRRLRDGAWEEWKQYTPEQPVEPQQSASTCLWLVRQKQPAAPYHWLLVAASEEGGIGDIYQVKGDAVYMHYTHAKKIDVFTSDSYHDSYNLVTLNGNGKRWVEYCANSQPPPSAQNAATIHENCQGWIMRVLELLEAQGVIRAGTTANRDYDGRVINITMASKTSTRITREGLTELGDHAAIVEDVKHLASYSWIEAPTPTIAVPGAPPRWSPPVVSKRLRKDSGLVYIS
ncbi:hypothetical protein F5Y09DRAFT_346637 [Xylaria sp. FL1042]|nr:hypothetical protein F5Y09DRAFT_346637 [Xylaria sp. FL1042]